MRWYQNNQNLILHLLYNMQPLIDGYYGNLIFHENSNKVFNPLQHVQNFTILQCTPLPLLKKKTSSPWPLMVMPLTLLPQDLASASPQYPGHSELSIPTSPVPLEG